MSRELDRNWWRIAKECRANISEFRLMLSDLRSVLGYPCMAQALGIPQTTLWTWFNARRAPRGASVKLVWLLWVQICRPTGALTIFEVSTWGRFTPDKGPEHAGKPPLRPLKRNIRGK